MTVLYEEAANNGAGLTDANGIAVPMFNYGIGATNTVFGKTGQAGAGLGRVAETYIGTSVAVDTLGQAALLLGEVTHFTATDSVHVPVREAAWDSTLAAATPRECLSSFVRSGTFPLAPGDVVSAAVYLLGDSGSVTGLMNGDAQITWSVDLIDSISDTVIMPMYQITMGAHSPTVMLPDSFPYLTYMGSPVAGSCVRMRVSTVGVADSLVGLSGLYLSSFGQGGVGFGKKTYSAGRLGSVIDMPNPLDLRLFPNPTQNQTVVSYSIPTEDAGDMTDVKLFDMLAGDVLHPVHDVQNAGRHQVTLDCSSLPSGRYIVAVHSANHQQSKLIILARGSALMSDDPDARSRSPSACPVL